MTRFTLVIHDEHRDAWPKTPWYADIPTPHGSVAVGMGATPQEAAAKALAAYRMAVALREHIEAEEEA